MAQLKTKRTGASVDAFIQKVDVDRREDCQKLIEVMSKATKSPPKMWGTSIVGFGELHYTYPSGREGDWFVAGFSPRKRDLTLYLMPGVGYFQPLLKRLGPHSAGKSCLYIKRLDDVDVGVLKDLVGAAVKKSREVFG